MTYVTVKERLIEFIKLKKISIRSFCRVVGVSETYVSSMRNSIQPDKLEKIIVHFPELNPGWLMTGEGKMLRSHDDLILLTRNLYKRRKPPFCGGFRPLNFGSETEN